MKALSSISKTIDSHSLTLRTANSDDEGFHKNELERV